jgi:hypothetical protein
LRGKNPTPGRSFADVSLGKALAALHQIANDDAASDSADRALKSAIATGCSGETCESFEVVRQLLTKMRGTAPPGPFPKLDPQALSAWKPEEPNYLRSVDEDDGEEFAWTLYALVHDLAPAVLFGPKLDFDTHYNNHDTQYVFGAMVAGRLKHLLDGLAATKTVAGGSLIDEVGIVMVSEMSRFPYLNSRHGKDHFPQISALLMGPGLAPGVFGETDAQMMGSELSLHTGRPGKDGSLITLDDLGRTVMQWVGYPDPDGIGFDGRVLEFCLA